MNGTINKDSTSGDLPFCHWREMGFRDPSADGLRVTEIQLEDPRLEPFVASHPQGTVYQHPAWLRTLRAEYSRGIVILACEGSSGKLEGIFPLMRTRGFPVAIFGELAKPRLTSLPRTPIAGPLASDQEVCRLLLEAAIDRVSQEPETRLQIKTEGPLLDGLIDGFSSLPWRKSFVVPLPADPSELQIGKAGANRRQIRANVKRAQNLGITVRFATSEADIRDWYGMYLRTMRRIVVPPRSLRCFVSMWRHMEPQGLMKVMLAERQNEGKTELLAGLVFLMFNKRVFFAFSACPAEYFPLRPNDLIHWEAIQWAVNNGFREYDMGEVPEDAPQLGVYKEKWGGQERLLHRYYFPQLISENTDSSVLSSRQKLLESVWKNLPLHLTAYLGDLIYSYL